MSDIDRLTGRFRSALTGFGGQAGRYRSNCPFCVRRGESRPDRRRSLGISLTKMTAHCFRCGFKSTVRQLAYKVLGADVGRMRRVDDAEDSSPPVRLPREYAALNYADNRHARAVDYLKSRGVTKFTASSLGIGYCRGGAYDGRIVFPITVGGRIEGFQARSIRPDDVPPYRFPVGFDASKTLYNFDGVARDEVVVVEGVFDVLADPSRCVASFGCNLSEEQCGMLASRWLSAVVLYDHGAETAALSAARKLQDYMPTRYAYLPAGPAHDPADAGYDVVNNAVASATVPSLSAFYAAVSAAHSGRRF